MLVTGCAGFIGMHTALSLLAQGRQVTGVDNLDPYYDVTLKEARLARLVRQPGFRFIRTDLTDAGATAGLFRAAPSGRSSTLRRSPASATRSSIREPTSPTT